MPVDDRTRLNLHRRLDAMLGPEEADTLMAHLPPVTWNEVATKDDLNVLDRTLRSEMQALGGELRGEMKALGSELRSEINALDTGVRTEIRVSAANLRTEMATQRTEIVDAIGRQTRWMVTFAAAWSTLLVGLVRLAP